MKFSDDHLHHINITCMFIVLSVLKFVRHLKEKLTSYLLVSVV